MMMDDKRYLEMVESKIKAIQYPETPKELYDPIRYTLAGSGKRLRPVLTLMACELFGGNAEDAVYPAISLELLHNFTLIHDDIMDQAPLRRGRETVYRKWNENIAILAGDTMFAMAYDFLSKTRPDILPHLLQVFNRIAVQICEGQQHDMNFEHQDDVSMDDYIEMIRLKTAVFFGGCMQIGAFTGGANLAQSNLIYEFGENLGIAFQLQDDILDVFGSQESFGKKPGGDIVANKKTWLYLKTLELADSETCKRLKFLYSFQPDEPSEKINEVTQIFTVLNIHQHAAAVMETFYNDAIAHFENIDADPTLKIKFHDFGTGLLNRRR